MQFVGNLVGTLDSLVADNVEEEIDFLGAESSSSWLPTLAHVN